MDAALLLGSPRGRSFCANLAFACSTDPRFSFYYTPTDPSTVREIIEAVAVEAVADASDRTLLDALSYATDMARYWQPPDEEDVVFARPDVASALQPIAQAVLEAPRAQWWSDPVDGRRQRAVIHPWNQDPLPESMTIGAVDLLAWRDHVTEQEERFRLLRISRPDHRVGGEWWSIPWSSGAWSTSRAVDGLGALELMLEEDSSGRGAEPVGLGRAGRCVSVCGR